MTRLEINERIVLPSEGEKLEARIVSLSVHWAQDDGLQSISTPI
ncbi:MAG: hypothetical protein AAFN74_13905 [Myxococcota bacterium]